ncbi:Golgin sub A member 2 [Aphanomyces cochlioides]|nr:Golgin sub A member 2 [Aphanomyces cochlioides]
MGTIHENRFQLQKGGDMPTGNRTAREAVLVQQNQDLNAAGTKTNEVAQATIQAIAKQPVLDVTIEIGSPPSFQDPQTKGRKLSVVHTDNNLLSPASRVNGNRVVSKTAIHVSTLYDDHSNRQPLREGSLSTSPSRESFQSPPGELRLQMSRRNPSMASLADGGGSRRDMPTPQMSKSNLSRSGSTVEIQKDLGSAVHVLEAQVAAVLANNKALEKETAKMTDRIEDIRAESLSLHRKLEQIQVQLDKQKTMQSTLETNYKGSEAELASVHSSLDEARRHEKQAAQSAKAVQIRLDRAVAELEKVKAELKKLKDEKGGSAVPRVEFDRVVRENTVLDKQKAELVMLFKKQSKLIDILKRQKIHLEAAKNIAFTEDEFSKTLDWGS